MLSNNFRVFINASTWKRDSHGLFDYEADYIDKCSFGLQVGSTIGRSNTGELQLFNSDDPIIPNFIPLFTVTKIDTGTFCSQAKVSNKN